MIGACIARERFIRGIDDAIVNASRTVRVRSVGRRTTNRSPPRSRSDCRRVHVCVDREPNADTALMAVNGSEPTVDLVDAERSCSATHWCERACKRAGSRIRTDDLLITNQLLYLLSYAGIYLGKYSLMRPPRVSFYTPFLYGYIRRP